MKQIALKRSQAENELGAVSVDYKHAQKEIEQLKQDLEIRQIQKQVWHAIEFAN